MFDLVQKAPILGNENCILRSAVDGGVCRLCKLGTVVSNSFSVNIVSGVGKFHDVSGARAL